MHYNNIRRINKDQEDLIQQHNKLKSKPKEDNINKFRIEKEREDEDDDIIPDYIHNEDGDGVDHMAEIRMWN
jgi:4-hydroxyphenylpyruvate dioxygenase-like putative hemolysin